ncbi:MAG: Re/Si-specific NAD(P)(+) transhydrogenase subunit alpha [Armatimonadetes bacterium]|nr:Re/Si-specific NAD(P)(+) transhydrogenase subunit alpha [Armatimonadota bacterium]
MTVGVPTETAPGEKRVALVPESARLISGRGLRVLVQSGAGAPAGYPDDAYKDADAEIIPDLNGLLSRSDVVLKVVGPHDGGSGDQSEVIAFREGGALISFLFPLSNLETVRRLVDRRITAFAMELMPRIARAQSMDALSSMSTVAGYRAALLAAAALPKFFPMLMTAAGTLPPARVFVIGAGVAGLQAIATCKRLGAVVHAFDVRPAVKQQVESLGAKFVDMGLSAEEAEDASGYAKEVSADTHVRELDVIAKHLPKADVVITTALVPGKRAPVLLTADTVKLLPEGSVIVDLAAMNGGNCELTEPGKTVRHSGVTIIGPVDIPSSMAPHASRMYSKNITEFLLHIVKEGEWALDMEDEIVRGPLVTHEGRIMNEPTRLALERGDS